MRVVILLTGGASASLACKTCAAVGYDVTWVATLTELSSALVPYARQVVLCEERNADHDWHDVRDLIRSSRAIAPLVVILPRFLSAAWMDMLRHGASEVVAAPLNPERLIEVIQAVGGETGCASDLPVRPFHSLWGTVRRRLIQLLA
jgi:DNA-binding NtrC family response regulator